MSEELADIKNVHNGNRFYKVDLHVHSPGSKDTNWGDINAFQFLELFVDKGIHLIAVTDHNSGQRVDTLKKAARTLRKNNKRDIHVIPGAEISVSGIHLVILFPDDTASDKIQHFLSRINIEPAEAGAPGIITTQSLADVCCIAHSPEFNGIVVGVHCQSESGVVSGLSGQARIAALNHIDILDFNLRSKNPQKTMHYVRNDLGFKSMPFIYSSDAHEADSISSDACWLKMDTPGQSGVRQVIFEPELRCRYTKEEDAEHPHIIGMSVRGGLYDGAQISLNTNLNILIGGRGAGKSALIDLLRFPFEIEPKLSEDNDLYIDRITHFLSMGDKASVYVRSHGREYLIERVLKHTDTGSGKRTLASNAVIFEIRPSGHLRLDCKPADIFPLEVLGQGEVFGLTKKVRDQRNLIDDYIGGSPFQARERDTLHRLRENGKRIISTGEELKNELETAETRADIEGRIKELELHTNDDIFRRYDDWEQEKRFFTLSAPEEQQLKRLASASPFEMKNLPKAPEQTPNAAMLRSYTEAYNTVKSEAEQTVYAIGEDIQRCVNTLSGISEQWREKYAEEENGLLESLSMLGFSDRAQIYKELQDRKTELARIIEHVEPRIGMLRKETAALETAREVLVDALYENRAELTAKRREIADHFNRMLGDTVRISIAEKADRTEYAEMFDDLYNGSGMRSRDVIFETLVKKGVYPDKLAASIFNKDTEAFETWGIPPNTATVLCSHPSTEQLFELQTCRTDDIPQICLKKEGEYDFTPLSHLSFGEKCSAVLSIVLLSRDKPLIIDQPEDELDHAFITENVVETIRHIKHQRQLIISTHNPNIPVLGDAELIIKVKKIPRSNRCEIECAGGLENREVMTRLKLLEGGDDALEKRSRKYGLTVQ